MTISEPILFDTNVLAYLQDQDSPYYSQSLHWHQQAFTGKITAVIAHQNLTELCAIITSPKQVNKPLTHRKAAKEVDKYIKNDSISVISPNQSTLNYFQKLYKKYPPKKSRDIFDLYLIATMQSNQITHLLTANTKDFKPFPSLTLIDLSNQP